MLPLSDLYSSVKYLCFNAVLEEQIVSICCGHVIVSVDGFPWAFKITESAFMAMLTMHNCIVYVSIAADYADALSSFTVCLDSKMYSW